MPRLGLLLLALALAGCAGDAAPRDVAPERRVLATDETLNVTAGGDHWHEFALPRGGQAEYDFRVRGPGACDVGLLRAADYAEHVVGEPIERWAWHAHVARAADAATLPAGTYRFLLDCRDTLAQTQVAYSLAVVA